MVVAHLDNKADNHTYWLHGKVCVHKAHLFFSNYLIIYIFLCIYHLFLQLLTLIYLQIIMATIPFLVSWRCYFSQCCFLSLCLCSHKKKRITLEGFSEVIWQDEISVLAMNLSIIFLWWSFHIHNKEAGSRQRSYGAWVAVSVPSIRFLEEEKILISAFPWHRGEMP